jgi:hypothetical protein
VSLTRRCAMLASAAFAVLLCAPGGASATNTIDCLGSIKLAEDSPGPDHLGYAFRCSEAITGFAIATNRDVAGFEPEVLVTTGTTNQPAQGEAFGCEGAIPGFGFACPGKASAWNWGHGDFHTSTAACSKQEGPLVARLVVTDSDNRISSPFPLRSVKCAKPKPKPKPKHRHPARHHG